MGAKNVLYAVCAGIRAVFAISKLALPPDSSPALIFGQLAWF